MIHPCTPDMEADVGGDQLFSIAIKELCGNRTTENGELLLMAYHFGSRVTESVGFGLFGVLVWANEDFRQVGYTVWGADRSTTFLCPGAGQCFVSLPCRACSHSNFHVAAADPLSDKKLVDFEPALTGAKQSNTVWSTFLPHCLSLACRV